MESRINVVKENGKDGCRTPSSIFSPCPVFNPGDFSGPRPPEVADVLADITESQYLDTSLLDNDPATTNLLMQLFLSDVTPEEELLKLGSVSALTPPTSLDVSRDASEVSTASTPTSSLATVPQLLSPDPLVQSDSGTSSVAPSPSPISGVGSHGNTVTGDNVISAFIFSASSLECTDTNGFNDPLDTPFLNESMDLTDFLQNPCVLNSVSTSPTPSDTTSLSSTSVLPEFCPSTPSICSNTDVHVSTLTNTHTEGDLDLFELAQTASITSSTFDAPQVENLDIDFSTFCSDTLSLVPSSPDQLTTAQLSVMHMLSQSRTSTPSPSTTTAMVDNLTSVSVTNADDVVSIDSSPSPPPSPSVVSSPAASPKAQKRTASDLESDTDACPPKSKKTKLSRRQKNNIASQVSRAKRRAKNVAMSDRVGELESANALLRIKEKELTAEIEKLKKLLVNRLSQ